MNCARCFYMDRRLGISRPPGFPFNLNSAVDTLLKKEFDYYRVNQTTHPLQKAFDVDAIPFQHLKIETWRNNFKGVSFHHKPTNFHVFGAVDDIWINPKGELIVVDYKATSKNGDVTIHADWQVGYRRQLEVYQWLLRRNGFHVAETGYFVYCNGRTDPHRFDASLAFDIKLLPYRGDDSWIEAVLSHIYTCLRAEAIPPPAETCEYCRYAARLAKAAEPAAPPSGQMKLV